MHSTPRTGWSILRIRTESSAKAKVASFGVADTKTENYCAQLAKDDMINTFSGVCKTEGCCKQSLFGVAGTKTREYCALQAKDGITNLKRRKCRTEGCGKQPSLGVVCTKTASTAPNTPWMV